MALGDKFLNTTVTFQQPVVTQDAAAGRVTTWTNRSGLANVSASVQPVTAEQALIYGQMGMKVDYLVFTKLSGMANGDRISVSDGRILRIVGGPRPWSKLIRLGPYYAMEAESVN